MKFPKEIRVIVANEGKADAEFLDVVSDDTEVEKSKPAALYRLVSVGEISVERRFVPKTRRSGRK